MIGAYRGWQNLNHEGLNDNSFVGLHKFERAKAIWLVVAAAPWLPLMISDMVGFGRGWLWYGWSAVSIVWAVGITSLMVINVARSLRVYMRDWRKGRKK